MTKEELKKSTAALVKLRTEARFKPAWMKNIPMTLEDFEEKEEKWLGFHYALNYIGLEYNEVKRRLSEKKTPWKDPEKQQRICQQAYMEHQMKVPKIPTAQTTQAKSKVTKPASAWRQDVEHRRSVSLQASSSKQRPDEQEESEDDLWRKRETRPASDRFGKRPRTKVHDESPKDQPKKEKTRREQRSRSRQERRKSPESVKLDCDDECKVEVKNDKGK